MEVLSERCVAAMRVGAGLAVSEVCDGRLGFM